MGCSNIVPPKRKQDPVDPLRRRLSLGEVDVGPEREYAVNEGDRALLVQLSKQQVLDYISGENNLSERKFSVGSETDVELQNVRPSTSKKTCFNGGSFSPEVECLGYACKKGLKPESPNQDSFIIFRIKGIFSIYGVFDGHGRKGHDVSNFVKDNLPKILLSQPCLDQDPMKALAVAFDKTQILIEQATNMKKLDALRSGTTASVVFHDLAKGILYMAHVGDSRVVLGRYQEPTAKNKSNWGSMDLTIDHKPDLPEERARIEKAGGIVVFDGGWNYRVYARGKRDARGKSYPGLNMARAMGDLMGFYDAGLSATPDVMQVVVPATFPDQEADTPNNPGAVSQQPEMPRKSSMSSSSSKPSISSYKIDKATDMFILLCSDGVWEFISSDEAAAAVGPYKRESAMYAANNLTSMAWKRWMTELDGQVVDDITALVVHLG